MKLYIYVSIFIVSQLLATASYAKACYSSSEAEAEQGVRIHSELMVIGLNCAHMADANGNNLYLEHKKFTSKHADLFATYEKILMNYMRKNNINPEKGMHKMRTEFANKISTDAAEMRPDLFCKEFSSRIEQATKMERKDLRIWAATPFLAHPVSKPLCD